MRILIKNANELADIEKYTQLRYFSEYCGKTLDILMFKCYNMYVT